MTPGLPVLHSLSFKSIITALALLLVTTLSAAPERKDDKKAETKPAAAKKEEPKKSDRAKATGKRVELNKVLAIVSNEPITTVDLLKAKKRYKNSKFVKGGRSVESQLLDILIRKAIVDIIAEQESIRVPPAKIQSEIKKRMNQLQIKDEATFAKRLSRELRMPYALWKEELEFEIKKEQIIQIRIQPNQPSDAEVRQWYNLNKTKVGKEVNVREIVFRPASRSIKDEIKAEKELNAVRVQALRKRNFKALAKDKRNVSPFKNRGGDTGWRNIAEIAKDNLIYANHAFQLRTAGQISPVFKTRQGSYAIIQSIGQRFVPLDKVYGLVKTMLFREKQEASFFDWIENQRDVIGVRIKMANYQRVK